MPCLTPQPAPCPTQALQSLVLFSDRSNACAPSCPPAPGRPTTKPFPAAVPDGATFIFFYAFIAAVFGRLAGLRSTLSGWVKGGPCRRCRNPGEITGLTLQGGPGGRGAGGERGAGAGGGGRQRARSGGSPRPPRRSGAERSGQGCGMEGSRTPPRYGSLESTRWPPAGAGPEDEIVSMADSTTTIDDIEGELFKIERIREILVRRESELRYMMDDIQLCKEISRLKKELQKLIALPENEKSNEEKQKEEELVQQIHKLVETRDFLVDDVEFERLREREEDKEMAEFLQSKLSKSYLQKATPVKEKKMTSRGQQTSTPYMTKTGLTLLKECCGFTCSIM
ncbi:bMERB domain-containing protein 1-like isoform 2-T3 [Morphnus guianensis]